MVILVREGAARLCFSQVRENKKEQSEKRVVVTSEDQKSNFYFNLNFY